MEFVDIIPMRSKINGARTSNKTSERFHPSRISDFLYRHPIETTDFLRYCTLTGRALLGGLRVFFGGGGGDKHPRLKSHDIEHPQK